MSPYCAGVRIALVVALSALCPPAWPSDGGRSATEASSDPSHQPNYADKLESPYKGENVVPRLVPARTRFPIQVAILDDGEFYRERWDSDAVYACSEWATATAGIPGGGLSFVFSHDVSPEDADVVIRFSGQQNPQEFYAMTSERNGRALVSVIVQDDQGHDRTDDWVRRAIMHEIGHSLGIWGHSPDPNDIMSAEPKASRISLADINTLRLAYGI